MASCVRTHSLVQSTPLLQKIFTLNKNLKYDFSLLTPEIPLTKKISWSFNGVNFWRLNFQWEDDAWFDFKNYNWLKPALPKPHSVLNFHPTHISLNTSSLGNYTKLKNECKKGLSNCSKNIALRFLNHGIGSKSTFIKIMESGKAISFNELIEIIS